MCTLPHGGENSDKDQAVEESGFKKGPWTREEDEVLASYVSIHGVGNWNIVQKNTGLARCGKSCRLRWTNHLRPDLKRGAFSDEEQRKVIELHASLGSKWAKMAQELPGRTDNEIKNFWNTRLKKRRRLGLPVYPDDIKPMLNDSEAFPLPELIFDDCNFDLERETLCMPSTSFGPENSIFEQQISDNPIMHHPKPISIVPENSIFEQQISDNPIMHHPKPISIVPEN
ncbi:Transcription factor MYB101, partial [Mucuna pruriens]